MKKYKDSRKWFKATVDQQGDTALVTVTWGNAMEPQYEVVLKPGDTCIITTKMDIEVTGAK